MTKPITIDIDQKEKSDKDSLYVLDLIRLKKHITTAPTFIPKKFIDQIQFFYDGVNYKLYLYINNTWVSVTLT